MGQGWRWWGVTPGAAHPCCSVPPLTLCSPRQSSMAVSWCRLVSEELRSCWTPRRSFCGREVGVSAVLGKTGGRGEARGPGSPHPVPRRSGRAAAQTVSGPGSGSAWW